MQITGSKGTVSSVAVSTTSATVLAANGDRKYAIIHNASGGTLSLRFGSDAATTSAGGFTVNVSDGSAYEVTGVYKGAITGILDAGSGNVSVTEIT